ncbi:LysE family translocator [Lentzea sp. NPDC054927]
MRPEAVAGFALAMVPIVVTPGASFTLMATHVLTPQPAVLRRVAGGTALGIVSHAVLAALGLSMLVMRSAELYRALQLAGALYLIALGIAALRRRSPDVSVGPERPLRTRTAFLANVLNPKAAAVYLTVAPQFLDSTTFTPANLLVLAGVHIALTTIWLAAGAAALRSLSRQFRRVPWRAISGTGGVVLIALGLKSLWDQVPGGALTPR